MPVKGDSRREKVVPHTHLLRGLFFLLISILSIYFFLHSPAFAIKSINVTGNQLIPAEEVISLTGVGLGTNVFRLDVEEVAERLSLHPMIENATVKRHLPAEIIVTINECQPIGLLPVPGGFIVIDKRGVYLKKIGSIVEMNLPIISGVEIPADIFPGRPLNVSQLPVALPLVQQMAAELGPVISEINVANLDNIKLYTLEGIEVRVGTVEQTFSHWTLLKEVLTQKRPDSSQIEYIDFSFSGNPVLKYRR